MSRIRSKDTKPEIIVRSLLHKMGYRFRLHRKDLPGKPDIVLTKYKTVILVHGCFWHQHQDCKYAYLPKSNTKFWESKFAENEKRDREVRQALELDGWRVFTIWECNTKNLSILESTIRSEMRQISPRAHVSTVSDAIA